MNSQPLDTVKVAVRDTFAAGTGRGSSLIVVPSSPESSEPSAAGIATITDLLFDLNTRRLAMWSTFSVGASAEAPTDESTVSSVVPSVIAGTTIYTDGPEEEDGWIAVPGSGLAASPLAPLFWLLGAVDAGPADGPADDLDSGDESVQSSTTWLRVDVLPELAVENAPAPDRDPVAASFTEAGIDLSDSRLGMRLALGATGLIRTVSTLIPTLPDPFSPISSDSELPTSLTTMRLALSELGSPVSIEMPANAMHSTVEEFVRNAVGDVDAERFRRWFS
ncbi:hypothetical protein [Phytoactinopolyspora limicola]|uniref:hypothetical protein n=1 Tax=Phytoactinopolyspora limicola TaxID=2715536 RepID=UPI0014093FFD|nr:hypothetical protein [Phytoactinopolyspora limicola]